MDEKAASSEAVALGDFNAAPETPEVKKMAVRGKFMDAFAAMHPKDPGLTWDNRNPYAAGGTVMPDRRIDYIFSRNNAAVLGKLKSCGIIFKEPDERGVYASDHFGLLAAFEGGV